MYGGPSVRNQELHPRIGMAKVKVTAETGRPTLAKLQNEILRPFAAAVIKNTAGIATGIDAISRINTNCSLLSGPAHFQPSRTRMSR